MAGFADISDSLAANGADIAGLDFGGGWAPGRYAPGGIFTNKAGYVDYGPYLSLAGGFANSGASLMQGAASARLARANAAVAGLESRSALQTGTESANLYRTHLQQTLGKQTAAVGGSGVAMSGSALRSLSTSAELGARDIAQIQLNASRKAWGFQVQQAGDLYRAKEAGNAGLFGGLGGLITSGSRAYGQWSRGSMPDMAGG